jgi:tetratricopeptide (TPR) repeat protein
MKKIIFVLVLVFSITLTFAQKNVRQTASNYLKDGKLDKALETINQCLQDPSTAQDAKAWLIKGNIYIEIANTKEEKYRSLDPEPLQKALEAYKKAIEYDPKKDYFEDIFAKLNWQRNNYFNAAVDSYNKKAYKDAMTGFENAASALSLANVSDTVSLFYAAACANLAGEKGKQKLYYTDLLKGGAKSIVIYASLADIYRLEKDSATALKVIRAGQKVYPNNLQLTLSESNVYIYFSDVPKALSTLNLAASKDSTNYLVFNAIGINYQKIYEDTLKPKEMRTDAFKRSEAAYHKAIKLKPDFYDVQLNIASLYFNSAVPIALKANALPLDEKEQYDKLVAEVNSFYTLALPYLRKADELQPNDLNTLNSLRQIYASLGDKENQKIIQAKILELRKK